MKRKLVTLLLALCCTLGLGAFSACDSDKDSEASSGNSSSKQESSANTEQNKTPTKGLEYTLSADGTYYILSGIGTATDTDIVIPFTYKNLPVTSIGDDSFFACSSLTSITIPDGVTSIGEGAFSCDSLTSVTFENTSGWEADSTALSSTDLADTATAAKYLTDTYQYYTWTRSDE